MKENIYDNIIDRIKKAVDLSEIKEETFNIIKYPKKQIILSISIIMDNGKVKVYKGYRTIHSNILGPSKGGIRYDKKVDLDEINTLAILSTISMDGANLPFSMA